jgi:hypothetical protein
MTEIELLKRMRLAIRDDMPPTVAGINFETSPKLMAVGREDVSRARLAEAHWNAIAILAEAKRVPGKGCYLWRLGVRNTETTFDFGKRCSGVVLN